MNTASTQSPWWIRQDAYPAPAAVTTRANTHTAVPFVALIVFTCILLLSPQTFFPFLKPLRIAFVAAGVAGATLLWDRRTESNALGVNREILICFALLAWAFFTVPLSFWPGGSVARIVDVYSKSVIVFWLLANVINVKKRLTSLSAALTICSIPLALMALKNYATGAFIADTGAVARIVAYDAALTSNPNDLALLLNLLLPLTLARLLSTRSKLIRVLCIGVLAVNVVAIIVTFSRAGFLGLATIIGVYLLRLARRRGGDRAWAVAIVLMGVLAIPFIPSTYVDRLATVKSVNSDPTGSSQARWRDIAAAARFVGDNPIIGAGIGMDVLALNQVRGAKWVQVHNVYLEYAVDLGLPGGILFLFLFHGVLKGVRTSRKNLAQVSEHRDLFLLTEALEMSLIVFAICGFFYPVAYHFFFYYIGGLALGARAVTRHTLASTGAHA